MADKPAAANSTALTHGLTLGGGLSVGSALVTIISALFKIDPALATAWVVVLGFLGSSVGALFWWWVKWKWPDAPPPPHFQADTPAPADH